MISFQPICTPSGQRFVQWHRGQTAATVEKPRRKYEPVILSEWASKGGKAVREKYGREHFVALRKRRGLKPKAIEPDKTFPSPELRKYFKTIAARKNGRKGGFRRAELFYPKCRQAMAREGGIATRNRYGNEFFREIRKKRTDYAKGYITKKTKQWISEYALQNAKTAPCALKKLWLAIARSYSP
jgi:hypothetical protein